MAWIHWLILFQNFFQCLYWSVLILEHLIKSWDVSYELWQSQSSKLADNFFSVLKDYWPVAESLYRKVVYGTAASSFDAPFLCPCAHFIQFIPLEALPILPSTFAFSMCSLWRVTWLLYYCLLSRHCFLTFRLIQVFHVDASIFQMMPRAFHVCPALILIMIPKSLRDFFHSVDQGIF